MAKRRRNKSRLIREALEFNPSLRNMDVIAELKKRKITVTSALVGNVRARMAAVPNRRRARKGSDATVSVEALVEAKRIADRLGGVEKAAALFGALSAIST